MWWVIVCWAITLPFRITLSCQLPSHWDPFYYCQIIDYFPPRTMKFCMYPFIRLLFHILKTKYFFHERPYIPPIFRKSLIMEIELWILVHNSSIGPFFEYIEKIFRFIRYFILLRHHGTPFPQHIIEVEMPIYDNYKIIYVSGGTHRIKWNIIMVQ